MNNKNELKRDEIRPIIEGVIKLTARGVGYVEKDEGFSVKKGRGNDIEIDSTRLNTALHGDRVRVRLLPKIDGRRQAGEIIEILFRNRIRFVGTIHKEMGVSFVVGGGFLIKRSSTPEQSAEDLLRELVYKEMTHKDNK